MNETELICAGGASNSSSWSVQRLIETMRSAAATPLAPKPASSRSQSRKHASLKDWFTM